MRLKEDCRIISLRGHHLLTTGEKSLEVNQSFAKIWKIAAAESFSTESLTGKVMLEYDITKSEAEREVSNLIDIWRNHNLLEDND